jgi:2-polyprenyl-6-methoxyphenol hydroxylase-like FAD-dependent oxidoreductase
MTQPRREGGIFSPTFRRPCLPDTIRSARSAGPCITYTDASSSCDRASGEGFVLIGDAAGYTDPCGGQGLSCAFDDVQTIALALRSSPQWDATTFLVYDRRRTERTRRIMFLTTLIGQIRAQSGASGAAYRAGLAARMEADPSLRLPCLPCRKAFCCRSGRIFTRNPSSLQFAATSKSTRLGDCQ